MQMKRGFESIQSLLVVAVFLAISVPQSAFAQAANQQDGVQWREGETVENNDGTRTREELGGDARGNHYSRKTTTDDQGHKVREETRKSGPDGSGERHVTEYDNQGRPTYQEDETYDKDHKRTGGKRKTWDKKRKLTEQMWDLKSEQWIPVPAMFQDQAQRRGDGQGGGGGEHEGGGGGGGQR